MSDQYFFVSSIISWFRERPDEVIRRIMEATFSTDPGQEAGRDMFRPSHLTNATTLNFVPTAAERLIRWDDRPPNDVFRNGFRSWVEPTQGSGNLEGFNLVQYVDSNEESIFVGTARYYRNSRDSLVRWRPRANHRFEYEIFAFGGIDVNWVLDPRPW